MSSTTLLTLRVLTPEGAILEKEDLTSVIVPIVESGSIGIRPGHAPLIAEMAKGYIKYRTEFEQACIELLPGVLDIRSNNVVILTAGEVSQAPVMLVEAETVFERLMQTLVRDLNHETQFEKQQ